MIHGIALNEAERARVGVGEDRLRAVGGIPDGAELRGDFVERFVPGDALESPFAFFADAAQRVHQALAVIRAFEVAIDLRAEKAARDGMIGIAGDANRATIANGDEHRAGVGAVVRARAAHDGVAVAAIAGLRVIGASSPRCVGGARWCHDLTIRRKSGVANGENEQRVRSMR